MCAASQSVNLETIFDVEETVVKIYVSSKIRLSSRVPDDILDQIQVFNIHIQQHSFVR